MKRNKGKRQRKVKLRRRCVLVLGIIGLCAVGISLFQVKATGAEGSPASRGPKQAIQSKAPSTVPSGPEDPLLILVNKDNPLTDTYQVKLKTLNSGTKSVAEILYEDLKEMLSEGNSKGLNFCIASAHRSSDRQQEILDKDIRKLEKKGISYDKAYEQVTRQVMPPGYSEHETGLALDITALSNQMLDDSQVDTPENQWLRENCSKYGFILRYPKGKENITKIDYEPWHFRYVGKETAKYITENDLTLEEYLDMR